MVDDNLLFTLYLRTCCSCMHNTLQKLVSACMCPFTQMCDGVLHGVGVHCFCVDNNVNLLHIYEHICNEKSEWHETASFLWPKKGKIKGVFILFRFHMYHFSYRLWFIYKLFFKEILSNRITHSLYTATLWSPWVATECSIFLSRKWHELIYNHIVQWGRNLD